MLWPLAFQRPEVNGLAFPARVAGQFPAFNGAGPQMGTGNFVPDRGRPGVFAGGAGTLPVVPGDTLAQKWGR